MNDVRENIQTKIAELAKELGRKPRRLEYSESIPGTGLLDSAALMELVVWFESAYDLTVDQDDVTMENFGSIDAMARYQARGSGAAAS